MSQAPAAHNPLAHQCLAQLPLLAIQIFGCSLISGHWDRSVVSDRLYFKKVADPQVSHAMWQNGISLPPWTHLMRESLSNCNLQLNFRLARAMSLN